MAEIIINNVKKRFKTRHGEVHALKGINLEIGNEELLVIVGPSGCGKTTLLKVLTGVEQPSEGEIFVNGVNMNRKQPKERGIALCFQTSALYPHLTIEENISLGLQMMGVPKKEQKERINRTLDRLQITELQHRKPKEMSGGQKQRAALARALARNPKVLLLDEPLSSLDAQLRTSMRSEIKWVHQQSKTTTICVTHDQVEAMTLADRIAVMKDGELLQIGTPEQVYNKPANAFVAKFIGNPGANIIQGQWETHPDQHTVTCTWGTYQIAHPASTLENEFGIRPEAINVTEGGNARVEIVESLGDGSILHIRQGTEKIIVKYQGAERFRRNDQVTVSLKPEQIIAWEKSK